MKKHRLLTIFIALLIGGIAPLIFASPMQVDRIEIVGDLPVTQFFRVEQYPGSSSFNLVESRNSIVNVGSYTLISNSGNTKFSLVIRPGEYGDEEVFAFILDEDEPSVAGKETVLPFSIQVASTTNEGTSITGSKSLQKQLGVRGGLATNQAAVYEDGEILAEIPDFDPEQYAAGHYSAVMQLSIEVL